MNKKNLGRITALGIAALTAVPTFSIVASADLSVTGAYRVQTGYDDIGQPVYSYYTEKGLAEALPGSFTNASGTVITVASTATRVTSIPGINNNSTIYYDASGKIYKNDPGVGSTAATWRGTSGSSTGTGRIDSVPQAYRYATDYYYVAIGSPYGYVYPNLDALYYVEGSGAAFERREITSTKYSSSTPYFDYTRGCYSEYSAGSILIGSAHATSYSISSYNRYASNTVYVYNGVCYPNYDSMVSTVGSVTGYTTRSVETGYTYSSDRCYFDPATGRYFTYSGRPSGAVYVSAGKTTGNYTVYYSSYTGKYYDSLSAANAATPSGYTVRTITNSAYTASYLNTYGYGYYNDLYNGYYDPNYYYYYYLLGNNGLTATTTTKDTSAVTIGNYKGWTNVARVISSAKAGSSYTVSMNTETEIPESVLKALKGKNIDMSFKFSNGAVITINGNDITSTTAISPTVKYGSTSIPSSLKTKAVKANNGVSSSQLTINGGSFGATASVTVKFNSKRSGCSAKLYRYNSSDNTLSLVSRSAVQSNGQCQFDNVKQGGEYIVVLS
ncbi:MAG: hypothetical protein HDT25_09735 [Ruminococcus sp.]|nr:hypothetical protein [Ruminococcus sp.]